MAKRQILDWSNFTEVPDAAHIAQLMADGWSGVILGTQFPKITQAQYDACFAANFPVEALYVFVYWDNDDLTRLAQSAVLADSLHLQIWVDCEWTMTGYPGTGTWAPDPDVLVALIHKYKDFLNRQYKGIYTGRWWWPIYTNNSRDFAGSLLWHADYSGPADFDNFVTYGGWTRPTIIQFSSNGVDGVVADLDEEEVPDMQRVWLYGNEQAGLELRGNQQISWNKGIEVDAIGDYEGQFPGAHYHHQGDLPDGTQNWVKVLP